MCELALQQIQNKTSCFFIKKQNIKKHFFFKFYIFCFEIKNAFFKIFQKTKNDNKTFFVLFKFKTIKNKNTK